ncbi:MAG: NADH-quinone oxidoreductase subunit H [Euryarchaeota archaeon]|jgi:NADH:ubiquinone oxidoreductase subunit H|nr:NADH-quinone oxidoreductase subunit H [Euryarchaeota archaeon]
MEDIFTVREWVGELTQFIADNTIGKTSLSDYSELTANVMTESIMAVTVFGTIMGTILALLWIERKFFARIMDRRGATMALRSLWVGEGGEHVDWYDDLPFGTGKPIRWLNGFLNDTAGNASEYETVHRTKDRGYHGVWWMLPGLIQNVADGMKFMTKEWMVPAKADKFIFEVAPFIIITSTVMIFAFIPLSSNIFAANPELSLIFMMAIFGIAPLGVFFAGWSSNNKYTLLGGIRSAAQLTAYEIPLLVTVLSVAVIAGSFNIIEIAEFQMTSGVWNIFLLPLGAALFLTTMVAEVERIPFDMPEAEAELVEGWWTEYGGMRWGLMFASEYLRSYAACLLFAIFFLGGWEMPFGDSIVGIIPNQDLILGAIGAGLLGLAIGLRSEYPALLAPAPLVLMSVVPPTAWLLMKAWLMFAVFVWIRASLHRIRSDQILEFGWRWLLPLSLVNLAMAFWLRISVWQGGEWPLLIPVLITAIALILFVILGIDEDTSELEGRTRPYSVYTESKGPASPRSHE